MMRITLPKRTKKKIIFLCCVGVLAMSIRSLMPIEVSDITNAVVNEKNGDIVFCYFGEDSLARVCLYSQSGEELFVKELKEPYPAKMIFDGNDVCIAIGHPKKEYSFDRQGNPVNKTSKLEEIKETNAYDGWKQSLKSRTYTLGNYTYCYEGSTLFRHKAILTISNGENITTIYRSP